MDFEAEEGGIIGLFRPTTTKKEAKYGHFASKLDFSE
jgi:hypothetical protein